MISAWDPGETTGWAVFSDTGQVIDMGQCALSAITSAWRELEKYESEYGPLKLVIVEDFRLFFKRAQKQSGSNMPAAKGIGMLEALSQMYSVEVLIQPPNVKDMAKKWSQVAYPADHSKTHSVDAYLHGYYYLFKNGIIKSKLQLEKERNSNG